MTLKLIILKTLYLGLGLVTLANCSSVPNDVGSSFASEKWRYETLSNPNLREQKLQELNQAEIENREYADRTLAEAENAIENQGRKRSSKPSEPIIPPPPPENATEAELDAYAELLRKLLNQ